jgi:hypothetical protein
MLTINAVDDKLIYTDVNNKIIAYKKHDLSIVPFLRIELKKITPDENM